MKFDRNKIVALLFLTLLMTSSVFIQTGAGQLGVAYIEPPVIYTNVCQEFTVTVVADVAIPIIMFEFWLNFNPTQISVTNVVASQPWTLTGLIIGASYMRAQGTYEPGVGPGVVPLAEITFHCIASGTSNLSFDFVQVVDPGGGVYYLTSKGATVTQYDLYWKPLGLTDYALSGIPDFDQKQDAWTNPKTGKWSFCGPTAIANSLWWLDSFYEPNPVAPPAVNDNFPLVWSYSPQWDDHSPLNVGPLINDLAWYMDTDGKRTGIAHSGTEVMDMSRGIDQYLLDHGLSDEFYQKTIPAPQFDFIEKEVEKCEDVTLLLGFWQTADGINYWRVGGHYVTVAGIDSAGFWIAFSDPCIDNAEAGGLGVVRPGPHGYPHDPTVHNDTLFASHDIYAALVPGPGGSPGNPNFEVNYNQYEIAEWYELINNMAGQNCPDKFEGQTGEYDPTLLVYTEVEYAVIVSPWYAKPLQPDYAPSGVPDFDQRQNGIKYAWKNPYPPVGTWSWCGPTAVANSLWWLDSQFEPNPVPPPEINDGFPLVESYNLGVWDDHDPQNVPYLIEHLAYLMNTDNLQRTQPPGYERCGTSPIDMEIGIDMYLHEKELAWKFYEHTEKMPDFYWIEDQVKKCEDVILLLGFWQWQEIQPGYWEWRRMGGHYVTVAGVDSTDLYIAISDPFRDAAEFGGIIPGRVLPLGHGSEDHTGPSETLHNNASYVSHDIYRVGQSPSPGGIWGLEDYYADEEGFIDNFDSCQNFPEEFWEWEGRYDAAFGSVYTEIEYAIIVSCKTGIVAAGSEDRNLYVWDFFGTLQWQQPLGKPVVSVAMDSSGTFVAAGTRTSTAPITGDLWLFDAFGSLQWTKSNINVSTSYDGGWAGTESKSVDVKYNFYNQQVVVAAATDQGLYLFDQSGNQIWHFDHGGQGVYWPEETIVRISQDGNFIVCNSYNSGMVHYFSHLRNGIPGWQSTDGTPVYTTLVDINAFWVAISGDGSYVAVTSAFDQRMYLINNTAASWAGAWVWWYNLPKPGYWRVDMPCHGRSVVAVNDDPTDTAGCELIYWDDGGDGWDSGDSTPVWTYWPGKELGGLQIPTHDFYTVAISENGDYIATGGAPANTYLLTKACAVQQIIGATPGSALQSVDLTFTGKYGASGDNAGTVWFFDKDTGLLGSWATAGPIHSVAVSKIYPCMFPFPDHDLAVIDVKPGKTSVAPGGTVKINAAVNNEGQFTESFFDVFVEILYDGMPQLGVSPLRATVPSLASGDSTTLTFTWDTTGLPDGNYTVIAKVSIVQDEIDVYDNTFVNGIVTVTLGGHDVAVINIVKQKTVLGQGYSCSINVTVANEGTFPETFNVTLYANTTEVETKLVTLPSGNSTTITFTWNTTGFAYGNYTIWAYAWPVPGETDTADNTYIDGWILVTIPADINGDFKVDWKDLLILARAYGSEEGEPSYVPEADFNSDGKIDWKDLLVLARNYGRTS